MNENDITWALNIHKKYSGKIVPPYLVAKITSTFMP